jgi:hypothetical protein
MKLPTLLKSLQPEEYKDFEKFLQSPFFKASEQYLKFFRVLCASHPQFDLNKTDLEQAYRRCFGAQALNDSKLYNLISGLGKQIEQFLVVQSVLNPGHKPGHSMYEQLLVKALGARNMGAYFRAQAQRFIEEVDGLQSKTVDEYLALSQMHLQVYYNPDTPKFQEDPPHLQLAVSHLDLYYCLSKLRFAAEMKARERILNVSYPMPLLEAVLEYSANPALLQENPLLEVYHQLVSLYQAGIDEQGFRLLKQLFLDEFPLMPKMDQRLLLRHLINCGVILLTRDSAVESDMLTLYKRAIDADMLLDGQRITHLSFINISNLAVLCKEYDWWQGFVDRYAPFLEDNKRQPTLDLAFAGLYYQQGLLDNAQTRLTPEIFSMSSLDIHARGLLIKIVFDRFVQSGNDYEFLLTQLSAFEKFVQGKQLTPEKKDAQLNWAKFVRRIATTKFEQVKMSEPKKASFRQKLHQLQPIISKNWLLERIDAC